MHLPASPLRARLHHLYNGLGLECRRFRYGVLALDLATIAFVIVTSFVQRNLAIVVIDVLIGIVLAVEFAARLAASRRPWRGHCGSPRWRTSLPSHPSSRRWPARGSASCG